MSTTACPLTLPVPEEPDDRRLAWRDEILGGAAHEPVWRGDDGVGAWLWARWGNDLEPAGMDRDAFVDVVVGYRRELWLWLVGDRTWSQMLAGLAGRVRRRAGL